MGRSGGSGGGGRSSGGGGGRSFGGGGGRSFGGRSGGSSYNRGGGFGGSRSGGSSWSGGGSHHHGSGGFYVPMGMGGRRRTHYGGGGGCGCLTGSIASAILTVAVIFIIIVVAFSGGGGNSGSGGNQNSAGVTRSTVERKPLPKGAVTETDYYTDELDWIKNKTTLTAGMKNFYQETGVQPYLYITDTIDGTHYPTEEQVETFAMDTYDKLFDDEAHFLLIFFEYDEQYHTWYLAGTQAKTVMDDEACDILLDYVDRYYYDSSLTDDQLFSKVFDESGERIMTVTKSPWIPVLIVVAVAVVILIAFLWWRNAQKQKNEDAKRTEKILETPLETFGSSEAENLAGKYKNS